MAATDQSSSRGGALQGLGAALLAASSRRQRCATVRPRHDAPLADYALLKRMVKERGLLARQPVYYTGKILFTLALVALATGWVVWTRHGALVFFGAPLLAIASGQIVLLAHDTAHGMIFASARKAAVLGIVCNNALIGGSQGWWTRSHNDHHARSNDVENDPDIDYPFLAFSEAQADTKDPKFRFVLERQHFLAFGLMTMVGFSVRFYSIAHLVRRGSWQEWAAFLGFWLLYPLSLLMGLGVGRGLLLLLAHQILFGVYVGSITAVNHWAMPMPRDSHRLDFVHHQVLTSRNVAGGWLVDLWFGGLNRQIEHHLFPTMPRNNLVKARPLVMRFCAERGLPYHELAPLSAYREIFDTLQRVATHVRGRRREPSTAAST